MNDGYVWWLVLLGAVIALAVVWVYGARLPREESDVSPEERRAEALWISQTIERFGGVAPSDLVEEVLELHAEYLASPRLAQPPLPDAVATPGPQTGSALDPRSNVGQPRVAGAPVAGPPAAGPPAAGPFRSPAAAMNPDPDASTADASGATGPAATGPLAPRPVQPRGDVKRAGGKGQKVPPPTPR